MKVTQVISWEGDRPVWTADDGLLSRAEKLEVVNFIANLVLDDETDLTRISFPFEVGEGRQTSIVFLDWGVRGLDISKNDPSKAYLLSQLLPEIEPKGIDSVVDPWSIKTAYKKISSEIDEKNAENRRKGVEDFARRIVLFRGSVFLASRVPLNNDEEEILFLLAEDQLNKKAIELQRLRKKVEYQRKTLAPGVMDTQRRRRNLPDSLVCFVLDRDEVCQQCGSDEELQLDHIIPVSRGGNDTEENLRILCGVCNRVRGNLREN